MSQVSKAVIRGRATMRPWRVGVLIDVSDPVAVRATIDGLSRVWGGYFLPILDRSAPIETVKDLAGRFDLDSLFAEGATGDLAELLQVPGYRWHASGRYAPLAVGRGRYREGLIDAIELGGDYEAGTPWNADDPQDLAYAAYFGTESQPKPLGSSTHLPPRVVAATKAQLRVRTSYVDPVPMGLFVLRPDKPEDAAWYWNCRALGSDAYPVTAEESDFNELILDEVARNGLPADPDPYEGEHGLVGQERLDVWGWAQLSIPMQERLNGWASARGVTIVPQDRDLALEDAWFPGFEPTASRSFRVEVEPTARVVNIPLPALPLLDPADLFSGVVAAQLEVESDTGLDPRLTLAVPPYRRHASLIEFGTPGGPGHNRVSGDGPVIAVRANADEVGLPTASSLEVMRLLFDDERVLVKQSDEGMFQSRAAEILGGPMSGVATQPGTRSAIQRTAEKGAAITRNELHGNIKANRGKWPEAMLINRLTQDEYATVEMNRLLNSGLLVPMLDVQCTSCRLVSRVHPNELSATPICDFCGKQFNLAFALSLAKPTWRYRLAGHLAPEKVQAMLPALAALSTLGASTHIAGARLTHVLGLEVTLPGTRPVEVDIATVLPQEWTVVIGEVKNHNRVDDHDVEGLGKLQRALLEKDVRCVVLFATLKTEFSIEEVASIRSLAETNKRLITTRGQSVPLLPLLLTADDMSVPWNHDDHPWRWVQPGSGAGTFGMALESCRRHLGLDEVSVTGFEQDDVAFHWAS